ncbi:MAG: hypothetical protein AAF432_05055 [Planctomycetota bacterium]
MTRTVPPPTMPSMDDRTPDAIAFVWTRTVNRYRGAGVEMDLNGARHARESLHVVLEPRGDDATLRVVIDRPGGEVEVLHRDDLPVHVVMRDGWTHVESVDPAVSLCIVTNAAGDIRFIAGDLLERAGFAPGTYDSPVRVMPATSADALSA